MGVEITGGMEWLLWLTERTYWLLEPWGKFLIIVLVIACVVCFRIRRPKKSRYERIKW